MTPESVGISKSSLVLGKHSGRHAFRDRIEELGYTLDDKELNIAFRRFKALSDMKKYIYDEDIEMIIMDEIYKIPERYKLVYLNVNCGNTTIPTASVKLEVNGAVYQDVGFGDGPVDAIYKIIKKIVKTNSTLEKFSINSITKDMDAQGEVFVKLSEKGLVAIGKGADTDIIVASAKAYINALNRLEYMKKKNSRENKMGMTITEKILAAHADKEEVSRAKSSRPGSTWPWQMTSQRPSPLKNLKGRGRKVSSILKRSSSSSTILRRTRTSSLPAELQKDAGIFAKKYGITHFYEGGEPAAWNMPSSPKRALWFRETSLSAQIATPAPTARWGPSPQAWEVPTSPMAW